MRTEPPPIPKKYTRTRTVHHWGADYQVTPAVAQEHLGNGRLLLWFQCMNTRPNYYLIRVDSDFLLREDQGADQIEEVIEVLEDEFGELSLDSGYDWWREAWLRRPRLAKEEA
jgi:hypothetical protein